MLPSLNQIEAGLVAEAMVQIELAMGVVKDQQDLFKARANITKTWQDLLAEANVEDRDKVLESDVTHAKGLSDPLNPVT